MKYTYLVQGSSPDPYLVQFSSTEEKFSANCSCPAGNNIMLCKHIVSIITGEEPKGLIDGDTSKIPAIVSAFESSDVKKIYDIFLSLESEIKDLQKEMRGRKRQVAKMLYS